ncbi:PAS domain-containing protein [Kutzneria viridogrisea]
MCEAIARLLGPHAEVVLHDPVTDRITGIWNPVSGRVVGDRSLLGELPEGEDVLGPYEKLLPDGRRLSSVSAVLRDESGRPTAVLCVNLDRTPLDQAVALLSAFAAPVTARPESLFEHDWVERINLAVGAAVRERGRPVDQWDRADRVAVLAELDHAGVFTVRKAVPVVARALHVSRSTLYALLAELRSGGAPA